MINRSSTPKEMNSMAKDMIEFYTHKVSEVHVDISREALEHIAKTNQVDVLVLRVETFGPSGRPSQRTLRLPKHLLEEPRPPFE